MLAGVVAVAHDNPVRVVRPGLALVLVLLLPGGIQRLIYVHIAAEICLIAVVRSDLAAAGCEVNGTERRARRDDRGHHECPRAAGVGLVAAVAGSDRVRAQLRRREGDRAAGLAAAAGERAGRAGEAAAAARRARPGDVAGRGGGGAGGDVLDRGRALGRAEDGHGGVVAL